MDWWTQPTAMQKVGQVSTGSYIAYSWWSVWIILCSIHVFEWADEVGKASGLTSVPSDTYSYLIMFHDIVFAIQNQGFITHKYFTCRSFAQSEGCGNSLSLLNLQVIPSFCCANICFCFPVRVGKGVLKRVGFKLCVMCCHTTHCTCVFLFFLLFYCIQHTFCRSCVLSRTSEKCPVDDNKLSIVVVNLAVSN